MLMRLQCSRYSHFVLLHIFAYYCTFCCPGCLVVHTFLHILLFCFTFLTFSIVIPHIWQIVFHIFIFRFTFAHCTCCSFNRMPFLSFLSISTRKDGEVYIYKTIYCKMKFYTGKFF